MLIAPPELNPPFVRRFVEDPGAVRVTLSNVQKAGSCLNAKPT
jgi:hypothetical protein